MLPNGPPHHLPIPRDPLPYILSHRLYLKCCDYIAVTGCIWGGREDQLKCSQWLISSHSDYGYVSVWYTTCVILYMALLSRLSSVPVWIWSLPWNAWITFWIYHTITILNICLKFVRMLYGFHTQSIGRSDCRISKRWRQSQFSGGL